MNVLAIALQPWRLLANPHIYIVVWLGFYGGLRGAVAGVLVAGYWIINRTQLDLTGLYQAGGRYWYAAGWNWRAVVATVVVPPSRGARSGRDHQGRVGPAAVDG